ncbi:MAG: N-acetylmuramoyl-L-alanine amidase-like domain-containing protein [bacterium]
MKKIILILALLILIIFILFNFNYSFEVKQEIIQQELSIQELSIAEKIIKISEKYLGRPYKANTLIGGPNTPEQLVINKQEVDCFTFLDYVVSEAFGIPAQEIRYKNFVISYQTRNHYFTDWINNNQKYLFLVSAKTEDFSILESGDLIGYYSEKPDLDVSHVGIILIKNNQIYLRHASSKQGKVLDEKLTPRKLVIARAFKEFVEPKIKTDLKYIKYGSLDKCFLQKQVGLMLENAQRYLPNYNLVVYDCARPISIQEKIWNFLEGKPEQKLFADPAKTTSLHSYGAAVDLTIEGLDMGSEFDSFDKMPLTQEQITNRNLLKSVMQKAGFSGIKSEWWHFEAFSLEIAKEKFKVVK